MKSFTSYLQTGMFITFAAIILFVLTSYQDAQAFVQWNDPCGSTTYLNWQNGGSSTGLFGDPIVVENVFVFNPSGFAADSTGIQNVSDTLVFELLAKPGYTITEIRIEGEYGAYALIDGVVSVDGQLHAQTLLGADIVSPTSLIVNPTMPISGPNSGEWLASTAITGLNLTQVKIIFTNNLSATGSASLIDIKDNPIVIQIIPEPATIGLLVLGSLAFLGKKK